MPKATAAPKTTAPIKLFISYAHEDEPLREKLGAHLAALRNTGLIADWHDRKIMPGTNWNDDIRKNLKDANLVLLLISSDFLNSEFCMNEEFTTALEQHRDKSARVIPVIMRPTMWTADDRLACLQALPKDGHPVALWDNEDAAMLNIAEGIRHTVLALQGMSKRESAVSAPVKPGTPPATKAPSGQPDVASEQPRVKGPAAELRAKTKTIYAKSRTTLITVLWSILALVLGGGLGLGIASIPSVQTLGGDGITLASVGGGALLGLAMALYFRLRGQEGTGAERALLRTTPERGHGQPQVVSRNPIDHINRWKQVARLQYERKELFKAALLGTRQRFTRLRALFIVTILIAAMHFVSAIASSPFIGETVWYLKYAQSLMLYAGVAIIVGVVFVLLSRAADSARGRFSGAVLIGGVGPLLCGMLFFLQVSPETLEFLTISGPKQLYILPGLQDLDARLERGERVASRGQMTTPTSWQPEPEIATTEPETATTEPETATTEPATAPPPPAASPEVGLSLQLLRKLQVPYFNYLVIQRLVIVPLIGLLTAHVLALVLIRRGKGT